MNSDVPSAPSSRVLGPGLLIWLSGLVCGSLFYTFAEVYDETLFFLFGLMWPITFLILPLLFVVAPISMLAIAFLRLRRRNYRSGALYAASPLVGLALLVGSHSGFEWLMLKQQIGGYKRQIEAAKISNKDVTTKNVEIKLGPPVTARFVKPQMMWSYDSTVYSEDDAGPLITNIDKRCNQSTRPLGDHFYLRTGTC